MSKIVPIVPASSEAEGNIKSSASPAKKWIFTFFNYSKDDIKKICADMYKKGKYMFQEEICPSTGKEHLQGFIWLDVKLRPFSLKWDKGISWYLMKGSIEQNEVYCGKSESKKPNGGLWTNIVMSNILTIVQDYELFEWQKDLIAILDCKPKDREILWIWEPKGNCGKTCFAKKMCFERGAILVGGTCGDMKFAIMNMMKNDKDYRPNIVFLDVPRDAGNRVSYKGLEQIKQGLFFSSKYESGMCMFNPPHLIVFANEAPQVGKLSVDKMSIKQIVNKKFVTYSNIDCIEDEWDF